MSRTPGVQAIIDKARKLSEQLSPVAEAMGRARPPPLSCGVDRHRFDGCKDECSTCHLSGEYCFIERKNAENRALGTWLSPDAPTFLGINRTPPARAVKVGDSLRYDGGSARGVTALRRHAPQAPIFVAFGEISFRIDDPVLLHADGAPIDVAATLATLKPAATLPNDRDDLLGTFAPATAASIQAQIDDCTRKLGDGFAAINRGGLEVRVDPWCPKDHPGYIITGDQVRSLKALENAFDAEVASKRIAELEAERDDLRRKNAYIGDASRRANKFSDQAGALANEKRELLVENAMLRRELEQAKRKVRR